MCGLYSFTKTRDAIAQLFALEALPEEWPARHKVLPGTDGLIVRLSDDGRSGAFARWGFRPWPNVKNPPINARAETVFSNGLFRRAAMGSRCLIPVDGFFEPEGPKRAGRRHCYFHLRDDSPFALAGICARNRETGDYSYAIVTTAANEQVGGIHGRMPVIVEPDDYDAWLRHDTPRELLEALVASRPTPELVSYRVTPELYKLPEDDPLCVAVAE
ncbi:MAG: SOS response-associated peptidase [Pseudomonadota bacterium]